MPVKGRDEKVHSTRKECLKIALDKYMADKLRIKKAKETPVVGPRLKLYHYIYDEKMTIKDAAWKLLSEFPSINVEDIKIWYNEEENRRLKERSNSNEAR